MLQLTDLKGNPLLKDLTEEQLSEIANLSKNDEDDVIAKITRRNADQIEEEIFAITGNKKAPGAKYFDYMKTEMAGLKTAADAAGQSKTELTNQIADLKKQLKEGSGDESLKKRITELEQAETDLTKRVTELTGLSEKLKTEHADELSKRDEYSIGIDARSQILASINGKKPKAGLDQETYEEIVSNRIDKILKEYKKEYVTVEGGSKKIHFRNEKGEQLLDARKAPHTPETLANDMLKSLWGKEDQPGVGTGAGGKTPPVSLGTASTQTEANEYIRETLSKDGLSPIDNAEEYQDAFNKMYNEAEVAKLPVS